MDRVIGILRVIAAPMVKKTVNRLEKQIVNCSENEVCF